MIPQQSKASLKNGIWFIHHDGMNTIQAWGSNLNGKEEIYLNNELISEQRNVKKESGHFFNDKNGQNYEVSFKTESLLKGSLKCVIKKEDIILKTFTTKYVKGNNFTLKRYSIIILASAIFGVFSSIYNLSNLTFSIFLVLVLIVNFITRDHGEFVIGE